jgi:TolA-binding protein
VTAPAAAPAPTPAERYAAAARLEASDAAAARAIYRDLAARSDAWGANALYALAELERQEGRRAAALRHLREYLRRFPDGTNAADARALLDQRR